MKLHLRLIQFIGLIVPQRLRADWRQEWEAELRHRETMLAEWDKLDWQNKLDLWRRSLGALWDALLLQPQRWEDEMIQDLRFGVRMLLKHKGFTLVAVLSLALGIGANTAIFSLINALMLRMLPVKDARELALFSIAGPNGPPGHSFNYPLYEMFRDRNQSFSGIIAGDGVHRARLLGSEPGAIAESVQQQRVSGNFFSVLGVNAMLGRTLVEADDDPARPQPAAVISYEYWQRCFGGEQDVIGRQVTVDNTPLTIVGVMPRGFFGFEIGSKPELWWPLKASNDDDLRRNQAWLFFLIGRLRPGANAAQAQAEMEAIFRLQLDEIAAERAANWTPTRKRQHFDRHINLAAGGSGYTSLRQQFRQPLFLLMATVGLVLLIACVNVANLLLARSATRRREMAVRAALGATRGRVLRQLLTESLLLALTGALSGLLLAWWGVDALTRLLPADFPRRSEIALDWPALGFALLASLATALIFGLAPAWQAARVELQETLKDNARGSAGARSHRLRGALVMAEVALSLVLLVGAGLLFRGFLRLQAVDAGFDAGGVLTLRLSPSGTNFRQNPQYIAYYQKVIEKLAALPGVEAVGAINTLPLGKGPTFAFRIEGQPERPADQWPGANYRNVTPDYFRALRIPIKAGRPFSERDIDGAPLVALINEAAARDFAGANPVGQRINFGSRNPQGQPVWFEIVGVVGDVRSLELKDKAEPEIYLCAWQDAFAGMSFALRTSVEPWSLAAAVRQAVREVDAAQPVTEVLTLPSIVGEAMTQPRFNLALLGVFGSLALLLSAAGIYGVTAYSVAQRTQEIGIRRALGAQNGDVVRLVLRRGMAAALVGVAVGLVIALAATRLLQSLLFEVSVTDPLTFGVVTTLLVAVALLACWIPARRATKVDPMIALRCE